jgi:hypothetical protein
MWVATTMQRASKTKKKPGSAISDKTFKLNHVKGIKAH